MKNQKKESKKHSERVKLEIYRSVDRIISINNLKKEGAKSLIENIEDCLCARQTYIKLTIEKNNIIWIPSGLLRESAICLKEEKETRWLREAGEKVMNDLCSENVKINSPKTI